MSGSQSTEASASAPASPSNEYSRLISFRIDWFDLLSIQGTLESLLQHHKFKSINLNCDSVIIVVNTGQFSSVQFLSHV